MCVSRVFLTWLRCAFTFLFDFILDLRTIKIITIPYCAAFGCKHHSAKYRELSLKPEAVQTIFQHVPQPKALTTRKHSIKRTVKSEREEVSKQWMNGLYCQIR